MHNMHISEEVAGILEASFRLAGNAHFEYITPELLLYVTCQNPSFAKAFENCGGSLAELDRSLKTYLEEYMQPGAGKHAKPQMSQGTAGLLDAAWESVQNSGGQVMELAHVLHAMYQLKESYAVYYMRRLGVEHAQLLQEMAVLKEEPDGCRDKSPQREEKAGTKKAFWEKYALLNDGLEGVNPLVGRKEELERTMQILCRREKNNPLHIGEPGVGKTAIVYGLARLLNDGPVPKPLCGAKIFSLDIGSLLAGTQYRGLSVLRLMRNIKSILKKAGALCAVFRRWKSKNRTPGKRSGFWKG